MPLDDQELRAVLALQATLSGGRADATFAPAAMDAVRDLTGADAAALWLRDPVDPDLAVRHHRAPDGTIGATDHLTAADGLLARALVEGPLVLDAGGCASADLPFAGAPIQSAVVAPIVTSDRQLGAIAAFRTHPAPFGHDDVRLLRLAGSQLGLVLAADASRAHHTAAVRRERLLAEIVTRTGEALTLPGALQALIDGAAALSASPLAALLLADSPGCRAFAVSGRSAELLGEPGDPLARLTTVVDADLLARGRPVVLSDGAAAVARLRPAIRGLRAAAGRSIRFLVLVPVVADGAVVGALVAGGSERAPDPELFGPLETLAGHASGILRRARLLADLEQSYADAVAALAHALEAKDGDTHAHSEEMTQLAMQVGRELQLDGASLRDLEYAATLHDIGKIAIPDEILSKPGPLTADEWAFVRRHTQVGERILRGVPFLAGAARAVRAAHERWDGTGYPDGVAHEEIPLLARIVFACDTWNVMTNDRPYRARLPREEALRRLHEASGRQLDPHVVRALCAVLGETAAVEARSAA